MTVRKSVKDKEKERKKKEKKDFDQVRENARMRRMNDKRFLEAQNMSEFKDGKEKSNE